MNRQINKLKLSNFLALVLILFFITTSIVANGKKEIGYVAYKDTTLTFESRVDDLVSRMTLKEKASQMVTFADEIKRLDIPAYVWWNECLHGVARAGEATVFPQAIGLASTWDPEHIFNVATAISDEARAIHHEAVRNGNRGQYFGLTYWSPNINLFRDPRWGRGQETYGEDPYLTSMIAIPFVKGLQGDHERFRKIDATVKHYAVHSGPEPLRHVFDADVTERELREYYLYSFEKTIKESKPASIMGAYNKFRGEACCASTYLFSILRDEWKFDGYMVSDCGGIEDIWFSHKIVSTRREAAALAVKRGCDFSCGTTYKTLVSAKLFSYISEDEIDVAVKRLMLTRMKLGLFSKTGANPYENIPYEVNDSPKHRKLNIETGKKSAVLLKNSGILPLDSKKYKKITIIGPASSDIEVLVGNYNGTPSAPVTLAMGIEKLAKEKGISVSTFEGCKFAGKSKNIITKSSKEYQTMKDSDLIIYCGGLSPRLEGEEGYVNEKLEGFNHGDRTLIELPKIQEETIKVAASTNTPIVMLMTTGSAISTVSIDKYLSALLNVWYPGGEGGTVAASILFGDTNPSGKLPVTFYKATSDLPHFEDYSLQNRTYRYFKNEVQYPFGHGLSYSKFKYEKINVTTNNKIQTCSIKLKNSSKIKGDEVVQIYARAINAPIPMPLKRLAGFMRVSLNAGESKTVNIELDKRAFSWYDEEAKEFKVVDCEFEIEAGSSSADIRLKIKL